ncbi:hypothetical protein FO519_007000 [Halicephalobus sp. NKZ332]|nr:hypothetical protein FO519_007000 [Halicephalobus sp. NKZ332]
MNAFFEKHFSRENQTTVEEWDRSLPTNQERLEVSALILYLMSLKTFDGIITQEVLQLYPTIQKYLNLSFFDNRYVVIHELIRDKDEIYPFSRLWGYVVIASRNYARHPRIHHSSPHFESDGDVGNQSAVIFERTGGRSLVIAGASRYTVLGTPKSPCQSQYSLADAAHNNWTMFHTFNEAIYNASKVIALYEDHEFDDYFIQWHGMSETSCPISPVLVSVGASGSHEIYKNESLAANKLAKAYGHNAHTPKEDTHCNLAATNNIFGRIINGVQFYQECTTKADIGSITGHFIHIEQKYVERHDWNGWINAVNETFYINS